MELYGRSSGDVCVAIVSAIDRLRKRIVPTQARIYWSEQTSMRTRMLLMLDWVKRGIFGRDLSKVGPLLERTPDAVKLMIG